MPLDSRMIIEALIETQTEKSKSYKLRKIFFHCKLYINSSNLLIKRFIFNARTDVIKRTVSKNLN